MNRKNKRKEVASVIIFKRAAFMAGLVGEKL